MRILVLSLRYPPYVAGGYELSAAEAVAELRARGHEVRVLCARGSRFEAHDVLPRLEPDLDVGDPWQLTARSGNLQKMRRHIFSPNNYRRTRQVLAEWRPDLVLYYNLALLSLSPLVAAGRAHVPVVGVVNDRWPLNHWLDGWPVGTKPRRRRAVASAFERLRARVELGPLLVPSRSLATELVAAGLERVEVLPLPLPVDVARAAHRERAQPRRAGEPLRVACISMLWRGKGQHVLLEALALARSRGAAVELVLAGSGDADYVAALKSRAAADDLGGAVEFAGLLERSAIGGLLASVHAFALPSLWSEPYGLVTLEAMSHGLAPIVTADGGSPEIVRDGVDGIVVPPGDAEALAAALVALAGDSALCRRLSESALARATSDFAAGPYYDALSKRLERAVAKERR